MLHPIVEEDLENITACDLPWERLTGKRVLVTGANGFLPHYLVETLLHLNQRRGLGIEVLALVRNRDRAVARFAHHQGRNDLCLLVQDVCEPLRGVDGDIAFIIHGASQASPRQYGADPVGTLAANLIGTHELLQTARRHNTESFLFISSGEVYGQATVIPTTETDYGYLDPAQVRSCYGEGKRAGEALCVSWHHQFGIPTKIVRPAHTYGPGANLDNGRVYEDFVADVLANRNITLKSTGTKTRTFCYVADATAGFFTALFRGQDGQAYNVSNDKCEISIRELANTLTSLYPERGLEVEMVYDDRGADYLESTIERALPSIEKLRKLGWQPHFSIEDGFRRTIESYR